MSFRTRLQSFIESRQKIQIWYGMGCHNTVTGRVLDVDHDHVDVESYSHESDGQIHVRRILVPMHLILHIDITSAEESEAEAVQAAEEKETVDLTRKPEPKIITSLRTALELPDPPKGYCVRIVSKLDASSSNNASRLTQGPGGVYFACGSSVWFVDRAGLLSEYARIRGVSTISGLRFDRKGVLYAATIQGTVYRIDPNKSGRVLAQLDGSLMGGGTFLSDLVLGADDEIYVSNFPSNIGGVFCLDQTGDWEVIVGGAGHGTQGLLFDQEGFLWCFEHVTGSVVKRTLQGREVDRVFVADPECFNFADGYDGNLTMDSLGRLYVTAGRAGMVFRVNREGISEMFLDGLVNPTGIAFGADGSLLVLEAGRARVLRVAAADKADRTTSATALS